MMYTACFRTFYPSVISQSYMHICITQARFSPFYMHVTQQFLKYYCVASYPVRETGYGAGARQLWQII